VAVPAVMIYNHFVRRVGIMLTVAENHTRTLRMNVGGRHSRQARARLA
jgi:biopolymer transport protein ExbB/TolQ